MATNALDIFAEGMRSIWGPLTSELVARSLENVDALLKASPAEDWLASLHRDRPDNRELVRDAARGFVLLAHAEHAGLYRPPHDHGRGWVIYAVQQGAIEMGTYLRVDDSDGQTRLVKRDAVLVRAGEAKVFLPGDIHDTRCVVGPALLYRFTERDLRKEDREEGKVTRYVDRDGIWTVKTA